MINDVSALRADPELAEIVRRKRVALDPDAHARHAEHDAQGPLRRQRRCATWSAASRPRVTAGQPSGHREIADPRSIRGSASGRRYAQNYELLAQLPELAKLGYPLVVGTSRKVFIGWKLAGGGKETPWPMEKREWGTAATVAVAILGGAHIVRVHDVEEMGQVARVVDAIASARQA